MVLGVTRVSYMQSELYGEAGSPSTWRSSASRVGVRGLRAGSRLVNAAVVAEQLLERDHLGGVGGPRGGLQVLVAEVEVTQERLCLAGEEDVVAGVRLPETRGVG